MATKKPSGRSGFVRFTSDGRGNGSVEVKQTYFPQEKGELESWMVNRFIYSINKRPDGEVFLMPPLKNELDDFDFTVRTSNSEIYLELMEIAPLEAVKGGHGNAPKEYNVFARAEYIFKKICGKSERYPADNGKPLCLLLYNTHFSFSVDEDIEIKLIAYFCKNAKLKFSKIYIYSPLDDLEGSVHQVFPFPAALLEDFDPEKYRSYRAIKFDPDNFELV